MISNKRNRPRIAFIFNFITPYRVTFFEKLCSNPDYEWLIIHGIKDKEDGRPAYEGSIKFPNLQLKFVEFNAGPYSIRWHKGIMTTLREWHPDIVITLGIPSILSNWLAMNWAHHHDAKTITWHSGWEVQSGKGIILLIKQIVLKKYLFLADSILVYSTKGSKYLSKLIGVSSKKITICYNGLEIDSLLENENKYCVESQLLRDQEHIIDKKIFLYVGGISAEKQVDLLMQAFQHLPEKEKTVLWIVGDGPDFLKIKKIVEKLKLPNVKFWGRVIENVDVFFAAADYFILPGVGGLAINQALFWKLPCIVSEADGTESDLVFENQTGFYFSPNDSNSLEKAMEKCLNLTDEQRENFGTFGRRLVIEGSNVNEMVETFFSVIQTSIQNNTSTNIIK